MLCLLTSVIQRKFKVILFFILLLAVLIHTVLDLTFFSGHGSCGFSPKVTDSMGIPASNPMLSVQNKLNLRILQDFSGTSKGSLEKGSRPLDGGPHTTVSSNVAHQEHSFKHKAAAENPIWKGSSKLVALFDHPLYKIPTPTVTKKDKLFVPNAKVKFSIKSSGSDEW